MHVEGLDQLLDNMSRLTDKIQKKAVNKALRQGANVILKEARTRAKALDDPETPERIYMQIKTRSNTKGAKYEDYDAGVKVGVVGAKHGGEYARAWFLEEGTAHQPAQPFMRPAANVKSGEALTTIIKSLQQSIKE